MATREFAFIVGPETSVLPTVGTPSAESDLVNLGFLRNLNTSSYSIPKTILTAGLTAIANAYINIVYLKSNGGAVNITGNPQISVGTRDGDLLILYGTSDTNTLLFEHGDGLNINGNFLLKDHTMITLMWNEDSSVWNEVTRSER